MSLRTKLGKRVLGTLISAAVAFSIIPSMVFADGNDGIVDVPVNITSTINANSYRDFGGVRLQAGASSITSSQFNSARNATRTSTFSVLSGGTYDGGVITGIEITGVSNSNVSDTAYGSGWSLSSGTLSWSGEAASSVSLSIVGTNAFSFNFYMSYSSITVHVRVPATGVSVTDTASATSGYAYVDDVIELTGAVQPANTTYDQTLIWSTDATSGIEIADNVVSPSAAGTYNITATMSVLPDVSGTYVLTAYEHVNGASITTEDETTFLVDNSITLVAAPTNADKVRTEDYSVSAWDSNNTSVATVADGVVTGVSDGTAKIFATVTDNVTGQSYIAQVTVTVLPHLAGIALSPDELELTVGDEEGLTIVYDPELYGDTLGTPVFESDDEDVATVSADGSVTAVGAGEATITVTVHDNTLDEDFTATCAVEVLPHLNSISLDPDELDLTTDSEPVTLAVVYDPEISGDELSEAEFASDDEDVVTVSDTGVVTVVGEGTAVITVTVYDNTLSEEFTATCNVTVSEAPAPVETVTMYRLYNPNSGEHFYTSVDDERNTLIELGWNNEGIGWIAPASSDTPVYRLYNENGGEHHYTTSVAERDGLVEAGWRDEGIGWYSADSTQIPVYRQYNPNEFANNHNYTTNTTERDELINLGWRDEGICWYGVGLL